MVTTCNLYEIENYANCMEITACTDQQYLTDAQRDTLTKAHNDLRQKIAEGNQPNNPGTLPSAKNMYELQYDCKMEDIVKAELEQCSGRATLLEKYGQNFFV
ncbi:hypothetical protein Aduo_014808 [Ancylostoma duodenale]